MNTTKKGKEFEDKVFEYFSSLLDNDEVCLASKKHSKIFKHKVYKCNELNRNINLDISIETYNPLANDNSWSSLVVIECKCYGKKVDISDFDEFRAKLNDISAFGVKGIMVTTKGFSQTEIDFARKKHIGLVVLSDRDFKWLVSRDINKKPEQIMPILLGERAPGLLPVVYYDNAFISMLDLLKTYGVIISDKNEMKIPFLPKKEIKQKAFELYKGQYIRSDDIAGETLANIYPNIKIKYDSLPEGILGTLSFIENQITLSNEIINDEHRRNFTLAHEIGHLYLHESIIRNHISMLNDYDRKYISTIPDKVIKDMEIQANLFASYLLVSESRLLKELNILYKKYYMTRGFLFLDHQFCNTRDIDMILHELSYSFNVSIEVIKIRLIENKSLRFGEGVPRRIKDIIKYC